MTLRARWVQVGLTNARRRLSTAGNLVRVVHIAQLQQQPVRVIIYQMEYTCFDPFDPFSQLIFQENLFL